MTTCDTDAEADVAEQALWAAFHEARSSAARERLFALYAAFARNIARRFHRDQWARDLELGDLCQLAYAGLLESIDRFDPGFGVPFRGYASHRISGNIRDGVAHTNEVREQMSWTRRLRRERARSLLPSQSGTAATDAMARLTEFAVGLALGFMLEGTGLYRDETSDETGTAYETLAWKETVGRLNSELASLPERERTILQHHYINGVSFDEIASLLAVSKGRVSQLHKAALTRLRHRMTDRTQFRLER